MNEEDKKTIASQAEQKESPTFPPEAIIQDTFGLSKEEAKDKKED